MICKNCGAKNEEGARFCGECGSPLIANNQGSRNVLSDGRRNASAENGYRDSYKTGYASDPAQRSHGGNQTGYANDPAQRNRSANQTGYASDPAQRSRGGNQTGYANDPAQRSSSGNQTPQQGYASRTSAGQAGQVNNPYRQADPSNPDRNTASSASSRKMKPLGMVIIGAALLLVLLIVFIVIRVNAKPVINLDKFVNIEVSGYDGYGKAYAVIDWDAVKAKYGSKLHFTGKAINRTGGMASGETPLDQLRANVTLQLDRYDHLSNGDKITYTWQINDSVYENVKVKLKHKDSDYKVSDLQQVETFDAFADIVVTFEGFAPEGTASVVYNGNLLNAYDFSCDKTTGLSNGDVVKVTWDDSNVESLLASAGKVPASTEKEYTVSGLDEYVSTYEDLTEDFINTLHTEAEDTIYSYTASDYKDSCALTDLTYAGYIFSLIKDPDNYTGGFFSTCDSYNDLFVIYSGTLSDSEGFFRPIRIYYPVRFKNLIRSGDQITYEEKDGIWGTTGLDHSWYSTKGYSNPVLCHKELVEASRDLYTGVCGDGFEKYTSEEELATAADITEDYKNTLYADAKEIIESYTAKEYKNGTVMGELSLLGEYFLLAKTQSSDYENNNRFIVVYSATVSNTEGKFEPTVVYFPVEYDGLVKLTEDEFMVTYSKGLQGRSTNFPNTYAQSTEGYMDGTKMFSELVTANRDSYTYEMTDGLKQFGE